MTSILQKVNLQSLGFSNTDCVAKLPEKHFATQPKDEETNGPDEGKS
jgi:hypothetical protein